MIFLIAFIISHIIVYSHLSLYNHHQGSFMYILLFKITYKIKNVVYTWIDWGFQMENGLQRIVWIVVCEPRTEMYIVSSFYKYSFVPFPPLGSSRLFSSSFCIRFRLWVKRKKNTRILISISFFMKLNNWDTIFPLRLWEYDVFYKYEALLSILCTQSIFLERLVQLRKDITVYLVF